MVSLLSELGVSGADDLGVLEGSYVLQIFGLLKAAPSKVMDAVKSRRLFRSTSYLLEFWSSINMVHLFVCDRCRVIA